MSTTSQPDPDTAGLGRLCEKPTCGAAATATLAYDYGSRVIWIDVLAPESHPATHDLCAMCADAMVPPKGWERRDQREAPAVVLPPGFGPTPTVAVESSPVDPPPVGGTAVDQPPSHDARLAG